MIRRSPLSRRKPLAKANKKRKASAFARCYGSKARVAWVKSLPCVLCGRVGFSENAHVLGNAGKGRKGNYDEIVPLCSDAGTTHGGCHSRFDQHKPPFEKGSQSRELVKWSASRIEELWRVVEDVA